MRCYQIRKMIDRRIDNELPEQKLRVFDQHIQKCPDCTKQYLQSQNLHRMLQASEPVELPSWIHNRILESARQHDSQRKSLKRRYSLQAIPVSIALIMSLYVGILVGTTTFGNTMMQNSEQTETTEYAMFGENSLIALDSNGGYDE